jgi:hypothetical protein
MRGAILELERQHPAGIGLGLLALPDIGVGIGRGIILQAARPAALTVSSTGSEGFALKDMQLTFCEAG